MIRKLKEAYQLDAFNFRLLRSALSRRVRAAIKYLYLRYVWPSEVNATEWSPEEQMKRITIEHMEVFSGGLSMGMNLDKAGGVGFFLEQMMLSLLKANDGIMPENYRQISFAYPAPVKADGARELITLVLSREHEGSTPHELKAKAEKAHAYFLHALALAFDPSGDTDCDEGTLLGGASMTRELRERAENAEAMGDDFRKERRENEALIEKLQAERDELAEQLNKLRDTWAQTVKTNGELGLAHTEALCEIGQLRSIIWHFALRPDQTVYVALRALNEAQRENLQLIWREAAEAEKKAGLGAPLAELAASAASGMMVHAATVGAAAAAVAYPQPPTGEKP